MAAADFKPALGALTLGTAGFALAGDNAGFCGAILRKTAGGQPARLESLTYVLPGREQESGGGINQSPVVVNLLMQLRASCDQNNIYLRTGQASQAQIMAQLRQTLAQSDRAVRAQAGEIERAVRNSLFQESEFRQALAQLEREVKKNADRPGRTVPLIRGGRRTAYPEPGAADRMHTQAQPEPSGRAAMPPLSQTAVQPHTQRGRSGQTAAPAERRAIKTDGRRQPGASGVPERKTEAREGIRQNPVLTGDVTLPEGAVPEQGAVPPAEPHPREAGRRISTVPRREKTAKRRKDGALQGGEPSDRPVRGAEAPQKAGQPAERDTGFRPERRRSAAADGQGSGDLPSLTAPAGTGRTLKARAEAQAGAVYAGSGEETDRPHTAAPAGSRMPSVQAPAAGRMDTASPGLVWEERRQPVLYAAWARKAAEKALHYGGGGEYPALPAPYPAGLGIRAGIFPMLGIGRFPAGLRIGSDWRFIRAFPVSFGWSTGLASRTAGRNAAPGDSALRWRLLPDFGYGNLSEARPASERAAPNVPAPNGTVPASGQAAPEAAAPAGMTGRAPGAVRGRIVWNSGRAAVSGEALELERTAVYSRASSRQVSAWPRRLVPRTVPADIRAAAVRYMSRGEAAAGSPGGTEPIRTSGQISAQMRQDIGSAAGRSFEGGRLRDLPAPAAAFGETEALFPASQAWSGPGGIGLGRSFGVRVMQSREITVFPDRGNLGRLMSEAGMATLSAGNMAPHPLGWLAPSAGSAPAAVPVKRFLSNPQVAYRTVYRDKPGRQTALSGGIGLNQRPTVRRTPDQWPAAPGFAGAGKYGAARFMPEWRIPPGMGGGPVLRWFSSPQTAAGTTPAGRQSRAVRAGRVPGLAEQFSPPDGRSARSGGTAPPAEIFRMPDGRTDPAANLSRRGGKDLLPVLRSAAVSGGHGGWGRLVPAAGSGKDLVGNPVFAKSAPDFLWRTQAEAGAIRQENALLKTGKTAPQVRNTQFHAGRTALQTRSNVLRAVEAPPGVWIAPSTAGRTALQMQGVPLQTATGAPLAGRVLLQTGAGTPRAGKPLFQTATGTPLAGRVLLQTGAGTPRAGKPLFQTGAGTTQAGKAVPQTAAGTFRTGNSLPQAGIEAFRTERAPARAEGRPALPGLAHFAYPLEPLEGTLPDALSVGAGESGLGAGGPAMIFRSPAPAAAKTTPAQEQEGESVLAAQTVAPEQARAMNRAFSYAAPAAAGSAAAEPAALPEQRGQTAGQEAQDVNYNRLTEEILVRIERRLRAERRKFGL